MVLYLNFDNLINFGCKFLGIVLNIVLVFVYISDW